MEHTGPQYPIPPGPEKAPLPLGPAAAYSWDAAGGSNGGAVGITSGSTLTSLLPMADPSERNTSGEAQHQQLLAGAKRSGAVLGISVSESKRLKRLEKNRESARECRRRKKEGKERLEAELATLEEENLNLRLKLNVGDEAEDEENSEISEIKNRLDHMISSGVAEGQISQTMDILKDRFADYGSAHISAADFHLAQLTRLLLPTLTTRSCMHAVLQAEESHAIGGRSSKGDGRTTSDSNGDGSACGSVCASVCGFDNNGDVNKCGPAGAGAEAGSGAGAADAGDVNAVNIGGKCTGDICKTSPTSDACLKKACSAAGNPEAAELGAAEPKPVNSGATQPGTVGGKEACQGGNGGDAAASAASAAASAVAAMAAQAEKVAAAEATAAAAGQVDDGEWLDMWTSLVNVLEATQEQQAEMRKQSGAIAELAKELEGTNEIMDRLKVLLNNRNQTLEGEMAEIQRILTPTQTAKFVLWVSKNKACVHMLNQLWDKLHGDPSSR
eukprot:jgi/Undpi1/11999/HiC_scaffold_4.g01698.m1